MLFVAAATDEAASVPRRQEGRPAGGCGRHRRRGNQLVLHRFRPRARGGWRRVAGGPNSSSTLSPDPLTFLTELRRGGDAAEAEGGQQGWRTSGFRSGQRIALRSRACATASWSMCRGRAKGPGCSAPRRRGWTGCRRPSTRLTDQLGGSAIEVPEGTCYAAGDDASRRTVVRARQTASGGKARRDPASRAAAGEGVPLTPSKRATTSVLRESPLRLDALGVRVMQWPSTRCPTRRSP